MTTLLLVAAVGVAIGGALGLLDRARDQTMGPAPAPVVAPEPANERRSVPAEVAPRRSSFFSRRSIWNAPLADDQPLDPSSGAYVAELRRQSRPRAEGGFGSSIMTTKFGVPIHTVGRDQRSVRVKLDQSNSPLLAQAFERVPIPDDARAAAGTDGNLAVWQPSTDTMWEFWRLTREGDGWHAKWGGKMTEVSDSPGYYRDRSDERGQPIERSHWGTTAAKFPLVAGVMTVDELKSGEILHALNFAIPEARKDVWSWPAQGTDGNLDSPRAIPEGARFRLDPKLDIESLDLPPTVRAMAYAAQRYGMVLVNQSGGVGFRAEDPAQYGDNPYPELFGGKSPSMLMRRFPWEHLQMLPLDPRREPTRG